MSDLSELLQIVQNAESACASVVKQPEDAAMREALIVALAHLGVGSPQPDPLPKSLDEAQVFAAIVRTRISAFVLDKQSTRSLEAIRHPAKDLLQILRRVASDIQNMKEAL